MSLTRDQRDFLLELLAVPTAPFRERLVRDLAQRRLDRYGIPWCHDPAGNLLAGVESEKAVRKLLRSRNDEPVRLYIAHMDHPGFHGVRWLKPDRLKVRWYGGSPVRHLRGAGVWVSDAAGVTHRGRLDRCKLAATGRWLETAEVHFADASVSAAQRRAKALFGGFAFRKPVWVRGQRLYTKAADDLVGVFCILETARYVFSRRRGERAPFAGLLSRAEEVGFVGAVAHMDLGWWQGGGRPVVAVSLEASRTLPGAVVGKGPVVRLGDRRTVFDANASQVLGELAEKLLPDRHQRRLMDGGACEGTVTTAAGLPTLALSVPLGNYQNQGFEGGPDCPRPQGPGPEFVSLQDLAGQLKLCRGLMRTGLNWADPWVAVRRRLAANRRRYQSLL